MRVPEDSGIASVLHRIGSWSVRHRRFVVVGWIAVRASPPKPSKLAVNLRLRRQVEEYLRRRYSPEQIVGRLRRQFLTIEEMRVSAETIYQSLYVQSRGALRRDLTKCLRSGRAARAGGRASVATRSPR